VGEKRGILSSLLQGRENVLENLSPCELRVRVTLSGDYSKVLVTGKKKKKKKENTPKIGWGARAGRNKWWRKIEGQREK